MKKLVLFLVLAVLTLGVYAQKSNPAALKKYGEGNNAFDAKNYQGALVIYEECMRMYKPFPEVQYAAANSAYLLSNYPLAKQYIDAVLKTKNKVYKQKDEFKLATNLAARIEEKIKNPFIAMVPVQGGIFTIGCMPGRDSDCEEQEGPAHKVTLSDFYIGKYEVTQAQWKEIMGSNPSGFTDCDQCPVESVSWDMVQLFIDKLNLKYPGYNYRLPTDAEWEFAARGGTISKGYKYIGSNNADEVSWYSNNSGNVTHPVGTKAPNELGIHDMGGNVWEWCSDVFSRYDGSDAVDPKGPPTGTHYVDRGGCWQYTVKYVRPSVRGDLNPIDLGNDLGFRLARSPQK